jgi:RNA polymerase sigma factor (sigma-70 family)
MKPALHTEDEPDALVLERSRDASEPFRLIFDRHVDAVHRVLCARVGLDEAEDLTAETFAVAWRKRASYLPIAATARPWLLGIAIRLAQDHERARHRQRRAFARSARRDEVDEAADAVPRIDAARLSLQLARALAALRREERDVVVLFALGELGYDEIALALEIRPGTVRSRLHRARARLAAQLPEWSDP